MENIKKAAEIIKKAKHMTAFTGAGISVESGIPPFRGSDGLWSKYDPQVLELDYFYSKPMESWAVIKEIFYDFFSNAKPNPAHIALAELEKKGMLKAVITQNIDNLHQEAGSKVVYEFHGNSQKLICTECSKHFVPSDIDFNYIPPLCDACDGLIKPDFIFFGEGIPPEAYRKSFEEAQKADVFIVIGTTGEVVPAAYIPQDAKRNGATIIEVNLSESNYTRTITDIFLQGKASELMSKLIEIIA